MSFAGKILNNAEEHARHKWEAISIQRLAIAKAMKTAKSFRVKANSEAYSMTSELSRSAIETEMLRAQAKLQLQDERSVQTSIYWTNQLTTMLEIESNTEFLLAKCANNEKLVAGLKAQIDASTEGEDEDEDEEEEAEQLSDTKAKLVFAEMKK